MGVGAMLANQNLLIETMQVGHRSTESVLGLLSRACSKLNLAGEAAECQQLCGVMKESSSMFTILRDASTADLSQVLADVKRYASDIVASESRQLQETLKQRAEVTQGDVNDRFKKLESQVLSELASAGEPASSGGGACSSGGANDGQLLKKDIEKKMAFLGSQTRAGNCDRPLVGVDNLSHEVDAIKYDLGELKDLLNGAKGDTAHVKRIVLACERDMEDFTAAMDAVNADLDEMRARVDSTHSIVTSRQRVEATVTAEISTMRLDMGNMQEALKAHDAWMEDVSQSLQEAHGRCHQLSEDIPELRRQTQAKLDAKTDVVCWNDMNDDVDASIKTVRDMASALRLEVDSRRRRADECFSQIRGDLQQLDKKVEANVAELQRRADDDRDSAARGLEECAVHCRSLDSLASRRAGIHEEVNSKVEQHIAALETTVSKLEADLRKQDETLHQDINQRVDGIERHHDSVAKETSKRLHALDLRISGLQGASGEQKRDLVKVRDEVNSLTVKNAVHDVDIGKSSEDIRKLERQRTEDNQRYKQDSEALYEELDQKVYEKNFQSLQNNVTKLTQGTVKLSQVIGVFPGARMNDGTEEELEVDVELLNWEDCAQNLTGRVEKTWRQLSSQKFRSVLDLVSKKADHSVLRLLQISQQHIESQLDRVRQERELWKEVVDKRTQQPLQLALALKDPHTGQPLSQPAGYGNPGVAGAGAGPTFAPPMSDVQPDSARVMMPAALLGQAPPGMVAAPVQPSGTLVPGGAMKASPLAKRITRPPQGVAPAKA